MNVRDSEIISGLLQNTLYYYRTKATNSNGTVYGNAMMFTTGIPPSVFTLPATTIISIGQVIQINGPNAYILYSNPSTGVPEMVEGNLPDGTVGMVSAKSGVSVLSLFD